MRIHIIACRIFARELGFMAAQSGNIVEMTWIPRGLHNTPQKLQQRLADTLEDIYGQIERKELERRPDYIVLGYGLCSNGVVGLECRDIPIVVPRTDDCIALFLGSQKRYMDEFNSVNGAYWLNSGWIENCGTLVDSDAIKRRRWLEYAEKYGEENADYLIEVEQGWMQNYNTCGFIRSPIFDKPEFKQTAARAADERGWKLHEVDSDTRMLKMMVDGTWNEDEFLVLKPGEKIAANYAGNKLRAVPADK